MSIKGKTVLITGGASGIGAATAALMAREGASVIIADVMVAVGEALVAELGSPHRFVRLDVSNKEDWESRLPELARNGRLDLVFLNAGVMIRPAGADGYNDPLQWMEPDRLARLLGVNLYGVLWGIKTCLPLLEQSKGTILVTSSSGGLYPVPFDPFYSMTKFGLIGLASSLAETLQARGVRTVTVCPHGVDTPMLPPDLKISGEKSNIFGPPSQMAESVYYIYQHAKSGEVWRSRPDGQPFMVPFNAEESTKAVLATNS